MFGEGGGQFWYINKKKISKTNWSEIDMSNVRNMWFSFYNFISPWSYIRQTCRANPMGKIHSSSSSFHPVDFRQMGQILFNFNYPADTGWTAGFAFWQSRAPKAKLDRLKGGWPTDGWNFAVSRWLADFGGQQFLPPKPDKGCSLSIVFIQ